MTFDEVQEQHDLLRAQHILAAELHILELLEYIENIKANPIYYNLKFKYPTGNKYIACIPGLKIYC